MQPDELGRYAWVAASPLAVAGCVSLVEGADIDGVAWGIGGDLDQAVTIEFSQLPAVFGDRPAAALRSFGPWTLAVEINGCQGSRPEVLRRLSASGQAVTASWTGSGETAFGYAADGTVLTTFEARSPDRRSGAEPDRLEQLRAGLPWEAPDADRVALMLALTARIAGIALAPPSLTGLFTAIPLRP